jgi:flagellar biosynthesis/type III secretory pathway protein FliH
MTNNKQQTAVEIFWNQLPEILPFTVDTETAVKLQEAYQQAKEMEIAGKEMSYADGYKEGYKRALEMIEWYIKNHISGMPQDHIVHTNKMI